LTRLHAAVDDRRVIRVRLTDWLASVERRGG
jgi:hypothetical protein